MRNSIKCIVGLALLGWAMPASAQIVVEKVEKEISEKDKVSPKTEQSLKNFDYKVSEVAVGIQNITVKEKQDLRIKVDSVNNLFEQSVITEDLANELKNKYAKETANAIEVQVAKWQDSLTTLVQGRVNFAMKNSEYLKLADTTKLTSIQIGKNFNKDKEDEKGNIGERRHALRSFISYGIGNMATEGAFANSEMRYMPSNYWSFGFVLKSRLLKNNNLLYLKYGAGLEFISQKPTGSRIFEVQNGQTVLADSDSRFYKSRLALNSVQIPVYLEFDFGAKRMNEKTGRPYFLSETTWRMGVGGFVNFADSRGKQVYHYKDDEAKYRVEKYSNLGVEKTRYGLGAYVGYKIYALQFQYELTPLFKNNDVKQNVWSLALRIDL